MAAMVASWNDRSIGIMTSPNKRKPRRSGASLFHIANAEQSASALSDLFGQVPEHRLLGDVVHLSLELVPVLQRHRLLRRGPRGDLVDHALEVRELGPATLAQDVRDQPRP